VDRTPRNPNLLCWHKSIYYIDHGASLYFHHNWTYIDQMAETPFEMIRHHVLLSWAARIPESDAAVRPLLTRPVFDNVLAQVPDDWLVPAPGIETPRQKRAAYIDYFLRRLNAAPQFVEEAIRARADLV
jgi:hypothetical protein